MKRHNFGLQNLVPLKIRIYTTLNAYYFVRTLKILYQSLLCPISSLEVKAALGNLDVTFYVSFTNPDVELPLVTSHSLIFPSVFFSIMDIGLKMALSWIQINDIVHFLLLNLSQQ